MVGGTKPRQFRLTDDELAEIDRLAAHLGLTTRTEVLRFAVRQLARRELPAPARAAKKNPAQSAKSC